MPQAHLSTVCNAAAERNKAPILDVLQRVLPRTGTVLEIASGTGQHAVYFARELPELIWQPTDTNARSLAWIESLVDASALDNVRMPLRLDVREQPWPVERADAVLCINMIHIAPWAATQALFRGLGSVLGAARPLVLYGPFRRDARHTAPSNEAFDADLKARNPEWGVRDLDEVAAEAAKHGLVLEEDVEMPANNLTVVLRRG
ncbi:DUF938 domain-containing protein [Candidatus Rariloculus sp.]|uniref:DUF938 domain-containing protein n=1 Tax=Candidatus Rariloculus sp. TaxID=3101265 RepID=UPI003D13BA61